MAKFKFGVLFSKNFEGNKPLGHIGRKLPVYTRLLEFCQNEGWEVYILTRKTYQGKGVFQGVWFFENGKFKPVTKSIKIDLVYDRSAGINFPLPDDPLKVVNKREFKILCWDKWMAYGKIGDCMPQTLWLGENRNLAPQLAKIKTDWVVLKPYNGLKGLGVFVGAKSQAAEFDFSKKYTKYIAQEFVDTSGGIAGIVRGLHDLRVAVVNKKVVLCHVRVLPVGSLKANVAGGGIISEVDYAKVPLSIKKIVDRIAEKFYKEYDNPVYSLDFGIGPDGIPKIFEINDQIGFPRWEMKARDLFLNELVKNFKRKIYT